MNDINIFYEHSSIPLLEKNLKSLCSEVLKHQSYNNYDISFIFVSDETLKEMKKKYFNQDMYTDVIAFNLSDGSQLEGEVYISFDAVKINSDLYDTDINNELQRIVIHGTLHLIGYEDNTKEKKEKMTMLEDFFIKNFNQFDLI